MSAVQVSAAAAGATAAERFPIPPLIRRNTIYLALAQAFTGSGMGLVYSIGPLMVLGITGSPALSGISVALMGLSRFVVAYPVGRVTDTFGRKPAMHFGQATALVGAVLVGVAALNGSFPLFVGALMLFGMGMNTAQQLRVAAADMFPPSRRAEGLGYVLTGSLVGVGLSPAMVTLGQALGPVLSVEPLSIPWLCLPLLIAPGAWFVWRVRPDPKAIAEHLGDYYPGYQAEYHGGPARRVTLSMFFAHKGRRVAVLTNMAAQVNMAVVMVNSSLLLHHYGSTLAAIAASSALHSVGMFGFSIPMGRLADRFGRRAVLLFGGVVSTAGALFVTQGTDWSAITVGAFLVGFGWAAVGIATLAVIADSSHPAERGRSVGLNESMAAAVNILVPLIVGPLAVAFGVASTGLMGIAVMLPALLMLILVRQALSEASTSAALVRQQQASVEAGR